jgi:DUF971 family protein
VEPAGAGTPRDTLPGHRIMSSDTPEPTDIKLHQKSRVLEISFADGKTFQLPCEFLRVYSPSAEVRGHGPGQEVLQVGKRDVEISQIEPVGSYAIQLTFSDGHDTGIYSWELLYEYGLHQEEMWRSYLKRLEEAGASRAPGPAPYAQRPKSK